MRERKYWIDYLKAIAIYLVILGHLPDELHIKWGIYLFHMPLFFIISGYLYKPRKVKDEIKKVITQLFLPYMFYGLGLIGLYCFMRNTFNISLLEGFLIGDYLTYIIHSGFISGYQNRYGDNLKPPTNVYHRMTA